jgi:hypothetical protein
LRNELIYGLDALNKRLRELMIIANAKPLKLYPEETRIKLFNELDKPYLRPLPKIPYVYREFKKARVGADYHITLDRHHYSVPYRLIGQEIDVWHTSAIVECSYKNECVAKHIRSTDPRGTTTCTEHMPRAHREYASLTVDKMSEWAQTVGVSTSVIVEMILNDAPHKEIGCKRSHGFLNLSKKYSDLALEAACVYALNNGIKNYKYIEVIIKHQAALLMKEPESTIPLHDNIRGAEHYH